MQSLTNTSEDQSFAVPRLNRGQTIGIIGGGQLGQMMALSARYMGFHTLVLDPTEGCPAAGACDEQIVAEYDDKAAIARIAEKSDILTYEFENVDADALDSVRSLVRIPQGTDLLRVTQNRIAEKTFINKHGIQTARWQAVSNMTELEQAVDVLGLPAVLKTAEGGYDGHGQKVLRSAQDVASVREEWGENFEQSIVEAFVDFAYEASILVSGNGSDFVTFPVVKNVHVNNILHTTVAPAYGAQPSDIDRTVDQQAHELAKTLAAGFHLAGTLAIELFIGADGTVIVNELAPRPHNSGHYTIEACDFDQFDLHVLGIAGWALPQPRLLSPAVMVNVLGQHLDSVFEAAKNHPEWHVHDYGKAVSKHNRKMGHVTVLGSNTEELLKSLEASHCWDN
ncbi:5-(carboxyamino)imidazole ribonucleotide synthase [Alloscardovia criceti]|uniref:5-(carboxyamino)imidazole ribonucleotide synthase n=1 Tax=Alloscardovia criceti TaxID=356828 RepID=UPI000365593B|nr:5-(carboxyamino)imidazole ribonucleotide synthase [Alloscardovia criceti]